MADAPDWDDIYDEMFPTDEEEEFEVECGMRPDGTCSQIGTEHCDWDCGQLNEQRIEAMSVAHAEREQEIQEESNQQAQSAIERGEL